MDLRQKSILITGATGFIGSNLTRHLVGLGIHPHIILRKESNTWRINDVFSKIEPHYCDIVNKNDIENLIKQLKPQVIFHTAIYGGYAFQSDIKRILDVNFYGTINLLNACEKIDYQLFVNSGSSSEYGIKNLPMKESDPLEPENDYGISKAASTLYCQAAALRGKKPVVSLRFLSPYGYFEEGSRLIPSVILSCIKKEAIKCSSPEPVRDFVFIDDAIDAYIKTSEHIDKISGEIINIGGGKQHSVGDVVNKIVKIMDYKNGPEWNKITNARTEPKMWQADISKARKIIGWQPKYGLDEGLNKTIEWFKENERLYK